MDVSDAIETPVVQPPYSELVKRMSQRPSSGNQDDRPDRRIKEHFGQSPLQVLKLNKENLLDNTCKRFMYHTVATISRCLPASWNYGGIFGLAICIVFRFRWGVLFSLTLYSVYACFHALIVAFSSFRGIMDVWFCNNHNWQQLWRKEMEAQGKMVRTSTRSSFNRESSSGAPLMQKDEDDEPHDSRRGDSESLAAAADDPSWEDVFHVVVIATYCTPESALSNTLDVLTRYSAAEKNMGVVLAMEQREHGVQEKADKMRKAFASRFAFVSATFHPPNLPNHIKGKASNMCWAFQETASELFHKHGFCDADQYRIIVTNMDDDSEFHDNYFEALTYHFLQADTQRRYLTIWQPPVAHVKNFTTIPNLIRGSALQGSMFDVSRLANPLDCHTPFSSNSMSLVLALAVGGWDPDWVSDDWHMMAKCAVMTEGRVRCKAIMLPLINLMPEEETYCGTLKARWTQAKRHALGVSEVVYLVTSMFLAVLECGSSSRAIRMIWRLLPLLAKMIEIHMMGALMAIWPAATAALVTFSGMWWGSNITKDQVVFNSMLAHVQKHIQICIIWGILMQITSAVAYFNLLKHRILNQNHLVVRSPIVLWLRTAFECILFGWPVQVMFGCIPEWIASTRIVFQLKIDHAVAAMIGRPDMGEGF
jgi:hypothetical protein